MRFDIISIFPESFRSYFDASILKRAQDEGRVSITVHDLRDYTHDARRTVDDTPYGGGAGMVMKVEPFVEALDALRPATGEHSQRTRVVLLSAKGKPYTQADARRLAGYDRLILLCGRYEGIDERVAEGHADEELSIGEYVLTGGELPAMVVVDSVTRLLPGVLGNAESAWDESFTETGVVEYPQYTKPDEFRGRRVPGVLLSGHHAAIAEWRRKQSADASRKRSHGQESI